MDGMERLGFCSKEATFKMAYIFSFKNYLFASLLQPTICSVFPWNIGTSVATIGDLCNSCHDGTIETVGATVFTTASKHLHADGTDATGYGAGGGGGWVQDGAQVGCLGHGGMGGNSADTLVELSTNDVLTITVGAAGTGVAATSWGAGGDGSPGLVMIKWWPDTLNLGL